MTVNKAELAQRIGEKLFIQAKQALERQEKISLTEVYRKETRFKEIY